MKLEFYLINCCLLVWLCKTLAKTVHRARDSHGRSKEDSEVWLEDYDNGGSYDVDIEVDSRPAAPQNRDSFWCPPPPKHTPPQSCLARTCRSDTECLRPRQKCCYNGCKYSCLSTVVPPPVVDWIKEPQRKLKSGNAWLLSGSGVLHQVEHCSTTKISDDEDALLCPHGYLCHIEYSGDPISGIPNRGRCMLEHKDFDGALNFRLVTPNEGGDYCIIETVRMTDGSRFMYHKHTCHCAKGLITCKVGGKSRRRKS